MAPDTMVHAVAANCAAGAAQVTHGARAEMYGSGRLWQQYSMLAWPGYKAVQSWEVAHRPLEEEQVVLVVGEVVPERKVPRADERIVVGYRAAQERVGAWLVRRRGLVTKRNCICSENSRPSRVCLYSCLHATARTSA